MSRNNAVNTYKSAKRPTLSDDRKFGRLGYFVSRAVTNIRQNVLINVLTVVTITLAILLVSLFLLVFVNLEGAVDAFSEKVQVTAYFDRELAPAEFTVLKDRIVGLSGVDRVSYVGKDDAMRRFRERLKGQEAILEGVPTEVLPSSIEITLKRSNRSSAAVDAFVARLRSVPGIAEVQYGEEWLKRFSTFMDFMRVTGAVLGGFLLLAVVFIVSNTIKLTIFARKEELEVLSLVGATRLFIKIPFMIEGVLQGATGAVLALVVLGGCYQLFLRNAGNFLSINPVTAGVSFLPPEYLAGLFCGGVLLGFFGSLVSLKRFVSAE
jgi:cell division transport system permease protein